MLKKWRDADFTFLDALAAANNSRQSFARKRSHIRIRLHDGFWLDDG